MDERDLDGFEDLTPANDVDDLGGPGLTESSDRPALERTRRHATRLGISVPGAVGGVLLLCAIAFGANAGLTSSAKDIDVPAASPTDGAVGFGIDDEPRKPDADNEPTDPSEADPTKSPESEPTAQPDKPDGEADPTTSPDKPDVKPEPTKKPKPEPTQKPEPKPTARPVLDLSLSIKEGAVLIKWSACKVDGADYDKVVRSSDSTVKWPTGENDKVVAVVEVGATPKAWDESAKPGKKAWYRVFCVRQTEDGYKVVAASETRSIVAPEAEPKPTPKPTPETYVMWIEAGQDGGAVVLHWEACSSDGFSHYRIVRKVDGEGSVIAEIDDKGVTTYVDDDVESGVTYRYVVQAKGQIEGEWVLLGTTEWVAVTVE